MTTIHIDYFTDILCVWAYIAQARINELHEEFENEISLSSHYLPIFGHVHKKIEQQWKNKDGINGYASHVQSVAKGFDHIQLHPDIWVKNTPTSSLPAHLYLSAIKLLERNAECQKGTEARISWALREAFFIHCKDISDRNTLVELIKDANINIDILHKHIDSGAAFAVLSEDMKMAMDMNIKSSPTLIFNEDRQRLTGNVGYKIIQANIRELLNSPNKQHSWC
jgi:predicted DsbA family dithiol-disulfide isomerase